ncbi:hypothetical protein Emed_002414 [Eimeria media]
MPIGGRPEGRRRLGGYAVSSERERRRSLRTTNHDVAQRAPTSAIFFSKPSAPEEASLHCPASLADAGAAPFERQRADGSSAWDDAALKEEAQECFRLFDRDGDGLVPVTEVATMLRSLGFVIRAEHAKSYETRMQQLRITNINFQAFSSLATKGLPRRVDPVEVSAAFDLLDREKKGSVNVDELHHLLTSLGDRLSEKDWQNLLSRTLTVRECASPVSMKKNTFLKLFCAPAEGEDHWSRPPVFLSQPNEAGTASGTSLL